MFIADLWYALSALLFFVYAALDGFDLGVGVITLFLADRGERVAAMRTIGPVWNGNEVWLIAAVGSLLAVFPPVYGAVLSGLYVPAILFLICIIGRDIAIEYRGRVKSAAARGACDAAFSLGSLIAAFLVGLAVGNVLHGLPLNSSHEVEKAVASFANPFAVVVGLLSLTYFTLHGVGWLLLKAEGSLRERMQGLYPAVWAMFGGLGLLAFILAIFKAPVLMPWTTGRPAAWIFALLAVIATSATYTLFRLRRHVGGFIASGAVAAFTAAWAASALFPVFIPSSIDPANSLTVANSAVGSASLTTLLILAAIGVPIVLAINLLLYWVFKGRAMGEEEGY